MHRTPKERLAEFEFEAARFMRETDAQIDNMRSLEGLHVDFIKNTLPSLNTVYSVINPPFGRYKSAMSLFVDVWYDIDGHSAEGRPPYHSYERYGSYGQRVKAAVLSVL